MSTTKNKLDITEPMVGMFIRFEVEARWEHILLMETLAMHYGLKGPSCVQEYLKSREIIDFENLVENGSNVSIEEYLKVKKKYQNWPQHQRDQFIRDRDTYTHYGDGSDSDENCRQRNGSSSDEEEPVISEKSNDSGSKSSSSSVLSEPKKKQAKRGAKLETAMKKPRSLMSFLGNEMERLDKPLQNNTSALKSTRAFNSTSALKKKRRIQSQ